MVLNLLKQVLCLMFILRRHSLTEVSSDRCLSRRSHLPLSEPVLSERQRRTPDVSVSQLGPRRGR